MLFKIRIAIALMLLTISTMAQEPTPQAADHIIEEALSQAAKENKAVFVIFHASWCRWCRKMDEAMNAPECRQLFDDHYVIRHLTVLESKDKKHLENPGADSLFKQYAPEGSGIPFWLIYDSKGAVIADARMPDGSNSGCPAAAAEVAHLVAVLKKTSGLNEKELQVISHRFRRNDPDFKSVSL